MNVIVMLTDDDLGLYSIQDENENFIEKGFHSQIEAVAFAISNGWGYSLA
jgi:hypothetical protein